MSANENIEAGNEAVETATIETPTVTAVIVDRIAHPPKPAVTAQSVINLMRSVRKDYPDPDRITVNVSSPTMKIRQDFTRSVNPPNHIRRPCRALVAGNPVQVGTVTVPKKLNADGTVAYESYEMPVYAAADENGNPWVDSNGDYVVIDPWTGGLRRRVHKKTPLQAVPSQPPKVGFFRRIWNVLRGRRG